MTDHERQLALAKMFPEIIRVNHEGTLCWRFPINQEITPTELLYVCQLVANGLSPTGKTTYIRTVDALSPWQDCADVLMKVKGVKE